MPSQLQPQRWYGKKHKLQKLRLKKKSIVTTRRLERISKKKERRKLNMWGQNDVNIMFQNLYFLIRLLPLIYRLLF